MTYKNLKQSFVKSLMMIWNTAPILIGVVLLISLFNVWIFSFDSLYFFNGNWYDVLIGSILGSVLAGNPVTSYVMAGTLMEMGVGLMVITSFIVSWVTVGLVQFPAESILLGKKFAIYRNIIAFIFSIIIGCITVIGVTIL